MRPIEQCLILLHKPLDYIVLAEAVQSVGEAPVPPPSRTWGWSSHQNRTKCSL
jgi:hypothetical protein